MAAPTQTTETWDAAWTTTMRVDRGKIIDQISDSYPTLDRFRKSGIMEVETGGKEYQEDLMYALNTSEWFDGYDELNTDAVDGVTAAFYPPRYLAAPITISMTEEKESRKAATAMKLLSVKTKQTMTTMFDNANAAIHGAQSGKAILGLQDICSTSSGDTIGGVDSSVDTWWDNQRQNADGDTSFLTTATTYDYYQGVRRMAMLWADQSDGNDKPNLYITTTDLLRDFETIFEGKGYLRIGPSDSNSLDGQDISFRGVPVISDRDCASGVMYALNTKYLKMKVQAGLNFAKTPFKEPHNQLAKVAFVVAGIQLVTNHRRRQGVIYNLAASS